MQFFSTVDYCYAALSFPRLLMHRHRDKKPVQKGWKEREERLRNSALKKGGCANANA
jgi:hypothetical protein